MHECEVLLLAEDPKAGKDGRLPWTVPVHWGNAAGEEGHRSRVWGMDARAASGAPAEPQPLCSGCVSSAGSLFPSAAPAASSLLGFTVRLTVSALIVSVCCDRSEKDSTTGPWKMETPIVGSLLCVYFLHVHHMGGPFMRCPCFRPHCKSYFLAWIAQPLGKDFLYWMF